MTEKVTIGVRLSFRVEGKFWNAYMADTGTMKGATLLGSILMSLAAYPSVKDGFMQLMQEAFSQTCESVLGTTPEFPGAEPAPEHERAGEA